MVPIVGGCIPTQVDMKVEAAGIVVAVAVVGIGVGRRIQLAAVVVEAVVGRCAGGAGSIP